MREQALVAGVVRREQCRPGLNVVAAWLLCGPSSHRHRLLPAPVLIGARNRQRRDERTIPIRATRSSGRPGLNDCLRRDALALAPAMAGEWSVAEAIARCDATRALKRSRGRNR